VSAELRAAVTEQIHKQHNRILRNEYSLLELVGNERDHLADFAEGFMSLWPRVEEQWQSATVNDGTQRMMQALFTSFMLAIDEESTQQQMRAAGIEAPPALSDFIDQTADELMVGNKSQSLNPFKGVGRNDLCPCQSGKKFKFTCNFKFSLGLF